MAQTEDKTVPLETVKIIENPVVMRADDNWGVWHSQLAQIFSQSWTQLAHLPVSLEEAREKVEAFRPNTFVLVDAAKPEKVLTQVHLAPVVINHTGRDGMLEFTDRFHTYAAVEAAATQSAEKEVNALICFSINSRMGQNKTAIPRSIWLINHLPVPQRVRKIAYSYMWRPGVNFFLENLGEPKNLGPLGLHKAKGGAQAFAILRQSRPEHAAVQGSNALAAYPESVEEAVTWHQIEQKWQDDGRIYTEVIIQRGVHLALFSDMINRVFL